MLFTCRFDAQTGADREVQRILLELLNQMDGFDQTVNVKVRVSTGNVVLVISLVCILCKFIVCLLVNCTLYSSLKVPTVYG